MTDHYGSTWERGYGLCDKCGTRVREDELFTPEAPAPARAVCKDTDWCFKQAVRREALKLLEEA